MNLNDPNLILWIIGQVVTAAAIWGGLRADIRNLHSQLKAVQESSAESHKRLDHHLERHR